MIRRLIDLILDIFPIYLEPLDVSVPPDMQHLLDQMGQRPWVCQEAYDAFASVDEAALLDAIDSPPEPNDKLRSLLK